MSTQVGPSWCFRNLVEMRSLLPLKKTLLDAFWAWLMFQGKGLIPPLRLKVEFLFATGFNEIDNGSSGSRFNQYVQGNMDKTGKRCRNHFSFNRSVPEWWRLGNFFEGCGKKISKSSEIWSKDWTMQPPERILAKNILHLLQKWPCEKR